MSGTYTLALLRRGLTPEWSRIMPFPNDAEAIAAAGRIAAAEARRFDEAVSLMVGRSYDEGEVAWLGGWDRDVDGCMSWDAAEPWDDGADPADPSPAP